MPPRANSVAPLPQLQALLAAAVADHPRGALGVADAVTATGLGKISRLHLARILAGKDIALRLSRLAALEAYLATLPLGGLFKPTRLLGSLAARGTVSLLLPRRPKKGDDLALWDVQALATVLAGLAGVPGNPWPDIRMVPPPPDGAPDSSDSADLGDSSDLSELDRLLSPTGPSIISFGSPRASAASERLMCRMFGVPEWSPAPSLPFAFAWPDRGGAVSTFATTTEALAADPARWRWKPRPQPDDEWWAFRLGRTLHLEKRAVRRGGKSVWVTGPRKSFGVVCAQQQPTGQLWLVAAGLSGPATSAVCGAIVGELSLRTVNVNARQPVWWVAVEVNIDSPTGEQVAATRAHPAQTRSVIGSSESS